MRIEQLMTKVAVTCRPGQSLGEVAQLMWESDCGCLPVTADDGSQRLLGVITDRDLCMAIRLHGSALGELRVEDAMTELVRACNPEDPVSEAMLIMGEVRVRRLPVVDDRERVIGLLALADLAREAAREDPEVSLAEVGGLLARICQPDENRGGWQSAPAGG
jgi:CBS domain-containing protein